MQKFNPLGANRLLQRLGTVDLSRLQPHLTKFSMVLGSALHAPRAPIDYVYFPLGGMVSLLTVMRTGEQIETAIVAKRGWSAPRSAATVRSGISYIAREFAVQRHGNCAAECDGWAGPNRH